MGKQLLHYIMCGVGSKRCHQIGDPSICCRDPLVKLYSWSDIQTIIRYGLCCGVTVIESHQIRPRMLPIMYFRIVCRGMHWFHTFSSMRVCQCVCVCVCM